MPNAQVNIFSPDVRDEVAPVISRMIGEAYGFQVMEALGYYRAAFNFEQFSSAKLISSLDQLLFRDDKDTAVNLAAFKDSLADYFTWINALKSQPLYGRIAEIKIPEAKVRDLIGICRSLSKMKYMDDLYLNYFAYATEVDERLRSALDETYDSPSLKHFAELLDLNAIEGETAFKKIGKRLESMLIQEGLLYMEIRSNPLLTQEFCLTISEIDRKRVVDALFYCNEHEDLYEKLKAGGIKDSEFYELALRKKDISFIGADDEKISLTKSLESIAGSDISRAVYLLRNPMQEAYDSITKQQTKGLAAFDPNNFSWYETILKVLKSSFKDYLKYEEAIPRLYEIVNDNERLSSMVNAVWSTTKSDPEAIMKFSEDILELGALKSYQAILDSQSLFERYIRGPLSNIPSVGYREQLRKMPEESRTKMLKQILR